MVRVKRGKAARKRRKHLLKYVKGFRGQRKSKFRAAKEALLHAWSRAYADRKKKKRVFRRLWQTQISAACRALGLKYSTFIHALKEKNIQIDRKILATIANKAPQIFKEIAKETQK